MGEITCIFKWEFPSRPCPAISPFPAEAGWDEMGIPLL